MDGCFLRRNHRSGTGRFTDHRLARSVASISQAASDTWTRIIETVFLAFLATTLGVIVAVPMSFFAARNLMRDISTPMIKLSLQILSLPIGIVIGIIGAGWARSLSETVTDSTIAVVLGVVAIPVGIFYASRWAFPSIEETTADSGRAGRSYRRSRPVGSTAIVLLFLISDLLITFGDWIAPKLGSFEFLGSFSSKLGDVLAAIITLMTALATAGLLMNLAGRLGIALAPEGRCGGASDRQPSAGGAGGCSRRGIWWPVVSAGSIRSPTR